MNRQLDDMDRADVEALLVMSRVHLEASRSDGDPAGAIDPPPTLPAQAASVASALADTGRARALLAQQNIVGTTRFRLPKRVILRLSRLFTHRIVAAVEALADAIDGSARVQYQIHADVVQGMTHVQSRTHADVVEGLALVQDEFERLGNSLKAQVVSVELASQDALDSLASSVLDSDHVSVSATAAAVSRFESTVTLLDGRMAGLEREREQDRREIQRLRALLSRRSVATSSVVDPGTQGTELTNAPVLDEATYVQFERRFRGSAQEIKKRQGGALRFVESIAGSSAPLLDLGCGRGEWLAVLRDADISAYGVDSNPGMVEDAHALELDVRCEDALTHLEDLGEFSLQGVSAFHFVEHVPLPVLTRILDAAFLALRPGGVLLLETPNPTNLVVGAASFYMDPTHLRQLHPDFLKFFVESRGFTDAEVHFVHPTLDDEILHEGGPDEGYDPRLSRVVESAEWSLFGPQDYVVTARRAEAVV